MPMLMSMPGVFRFNLGWMATMRRGPTALLGPMALLAVPLLMAMLAPPMFGLGGAARGAEDADALARRLIAAEEKGLAIPVLSLEVDDLDMDLAYRIQKAYVARRLEGREQIAGYKAGLTGILGRLWFGSVDPLLGVMFRSGRRRSGAEITLAAYRRLIMETEIFMVVGKRIRAPVADVAALRPLIRGAVAAIEMPETGFSKSGRATAEDLVAANSAAAIHVIGRERPVGDLDLARVTVTMRADGEVLSEGDGSEALGGDPWKGALWLVNAALEHGMPVEPGQLLSTGLIGDRVRTRPGTYIVDYGPLGELTVILK